jgi:hypothetical protein
LKPIVGVLEYIVDGIFRTLVLLYYVIEKLLSLVKISEQEVAVRLNGIVDFRYYIEFGFHNVGGVGCVG